jgi:hypothetical protein
VSVTDVVVYISSRNDENGSIKLFKCLMSCVYHILKFDLLFIFLRSRSETVFKTSFSY